MNGGLVFTVAFVVVLAVCLRMRASVIVTLGGSVLAGFVALVVLGERQPVGVDESTVAAAVAGSDDFKLASTQRAPCRRATPAPSPLARGVAFPAPVSPRKLGGPIDS